MLKLVKVNQVLGKINDKSIVFEWVPSHTNIIGDELVIKQPRKQYISIDCLLI